jgi:hypothetical protein
MKLVELRERIISMLNFPQTIKISYLDPAHSVEGALDVLERETIYNLNTRLQWIIARVLLVTSSIEHETTVGLEEYLLASRFWENSGGSYICGRIFDSEWCLNGISFAIVVVEHLRERS